MTDKKIIEQTLERYRTIYHIVYELQSGICCDGSKELGIPICVACQENKDANGHFTCEKCIIGKLWGKCDNAG